MGRSGDASETVPSKVCPTCGRAFTWRKKWAEVWDEVTYCSKRCRGRRLDATDEALEAALLELARARGRSKTLCPSEAARGLTEDWRALLPQTHDAARRLAQRGALVMLQRGRRVDPSRVRGAYRLRLGQRSG